jgi:hypothetical protein
MKIKGIPTKNQPVVVSYGTWERIRTAAYHKHVTIKFIIESVFSGKLNPLTMESMQ